MISVYSGVTSIMSSNIDNFGFNDGQFYQFSRQSGEYCGTKRLTKNYTRWRTCINR